MKLPEYTTTKEIKIKLRGYEAEIVDLLLKSEKHHELNHFVTMCAQCELLESDTFEDHLIRVLESGLDSPSIQILTSADVEVESTNHERDHLELTLNLEVEI